MKILKIEKEDSKISRKMIARFGESIYRYPEVRAVSIKVHFRDGSVIGFNRDEDEDEFEEMIEKAKED